MALVRNDRTGPPKKRQSVAPPKQNIAVFLLSSTMTVAPL